MNRLSMLLLLIVICGGQYYLANGAIKSKQGSYTTYYVTSLKEEGRLDQKNKRHILLQVTKSSDMKTTTPFNCITIYIDAYKRNDSTEIITII